MGTELGDHWAGAVGEVEERSSSQKGIVELIIVEKRKNEYTE